MLCNWLGPDHAGIGTDFIDDMTPTWEGVLSEKETAWRDPYGTQLYEGVAFAPEQLGELVQLMISAGYPGDAIENILGGNFHRIFEFYERYDQQHAPKQTAGQN